MNKIASAIQLYYLIPESFIYQAVNALNKHFIKITLIIGIVFSIYPIMQAVNLAQQIAKAESSLKYLETEIIEKENMLKNKLVEKGSDANIVLTPTKINQQLENLLQQQNVEINNMQWELEQDKQINITLTQKAKNLFELIHQLNKIDYLRIKELTLTRLDYQHLVQLNATLQLVK